MKLFYALRSPQIIVLIVVALVIAFISAHYLFNASVTNAIPWGLLAFATAFIAKSKKDSLILGGLFGFVVSYSFLWFDDKSISTSKVLILIPLIVLPALLGMFCGSLAALLGWTSRQALKKATQ